jgi:hypothetical protein
MLWRPCRGLKCLLIAIRREYLYVQPQKMFQYVDLKVSVVLLCVTILYVFIFGQGNGQYDIGSE